MPYSVQKQVKVLNFDSRLLYQGYNQDFGPLNIGHISVYCKEIDELVRNGTVVIHHTTTFHKTLANQAMLMAAYLMICKQHSASKAWAKFRTVDRELIPYCDSGARYNSFGLRVLDCLRALEMAMERGWFKYAQFNAQEYFRMN